MSIGPITIFDKSALEALNPDEAALFGQFYLINLTPLFFIETLADLEKRVRDGQTPDHVVGSIAYRTANMSAHPNAHHDLIVVNELLGRQRVPMDGRIMVAGGRNVQSRGKSGVVFEDAPEAIALHRFQQHEFLEVERDIAREWRASLVEETSHKWDVTAMLETIKRPRTFAEVKALAAGFVRLRGQAFFSALDLLQIHPRARAYIVPHWLDRGAPSLARFAPYSAHVATVQLFFRLAIGLDMISADRPSNSADIAYLY